MNVVKIMDVAKLNINKDAVTDKAEGNFTEQFDKAVHDVSKKSHSVHKKQKDIAAETSGESAHVQTLGCETNQKEEIANDALALAAMPVEVVVLQNERMSESTEVLSNQGIAVSAVELTEKMDASKLQSTTLDIAPMPDVDAVNTDRNLVKQTNASKQTVIVEAQDQETAEFVSQTLKETNTILKQQSNGLDMSVQRDVGVAMIHGEQVDQEADFTDEKQEKEPYTKPMTATVSKDGAVEFKQNVQPPLKPEAVQQDKSMLPRIVNQVKTNISADKTEFYVQLKPEHLGGLSILLASEERGLIAKLVTGNKEVQTMIQNDMLAMQEALREKGIQVVHMEVIYDQMATATNKDNFSQGHSWANESQTSVHGRTQDRMDQSTLIYDDMTVYEVLAEQGGSVEFSA